MRKLALYSILFVLLGNLQAQGFRITVKTPDFPVDSLFLYAYNYSKQQFKPVYSIKYASEVVFSDNKYLKPGLYLINADSNIVVEFLISDYRQQPFSIEIKENEAIFSGSEENTVNMQYMQSIRAYDQQMAQINSQYQQLRRNSPSLEAVQTQLDSLILQSEAVNRQKLAYQSQVAEENKGSLLASIILSVMEVPPPPVAYYQDRTLYYRYLAEHCFYKYDFSDDRILATPLAMSKFRMFSEIISELETRDAIPYVLDALRKSQASPQQYYDFFDYLEQHVGVAKSPFRKEALYIEMLRYAIDSTYIDPFRKERYLYELNVIDKNHAGEKMPNFNLIMQNGDTSSLYDIQAERMILYFQNPDCPTCAKTIQKMKEMEALNRAVSTKKITILTVYFEKDTQLWQKYLQNHAPSDWKHGWNYDLGIEDKNLVDIRGIPLIYFLDKNKTILKKDARIFEVERFLQEE